MPPRLTPLEVSLLALDTAHTPHHVGSVDIVACGPDGVSYEALVGLVGERIAYVPRFRQRVRSVPARLAPPVWVDDERFDLAFHIRRSALPRPGSMEQLREFTGRVVSRRLDHARPLWELYLVEGLEGDRSALVTKSHLCLIDGVETVALNQVLLEAAADTPEASPTAPLPWRPVPEPSGTELVAGALWESARDPVRAVDSARGALVEAVGTVVAVGEAVGGAGALLGRLAGEVLRGGRPPADSPLAGAVSEQRRVATVRLTLADLKAVRAEQAHTINDVVLAVLTGALRTWLLTRGEPISFSSSLTALVPLSVTEQGGLPTSLGSSVAPHLQTLPIGEPTPLLRLAHLAHGTQVHKDTGRAVTARSLADLAGFAPATLHALGVRAAAEVMRKPHDLVVTNVPGPQLPVQVAGSPLLESYPVLPLGAGHLLAIGVTSYSGGVFLGFTADRDAVPDLDVLASCVPGALEELLEAGGRGRPPTRKAPAAAHRAAARRAAAKRAAAKRAGAKQAGAKQAAAKHAAVKQAAARQDASALTGRRRAAIRRLAPPPATPGT